MQKNIIVSLKDISLEYNGTSGKMMAIHNINLDIIRGEFICMLGTSGCGKSTLLNIMAGLLKPTSGTAVMNGREIDAPDWTRGVVFQNPPLYPWLNVYDNIAFGLRKRKLPKNEIRNQVEEYLEFVGLQDFRNYKPYELSGGMRQRVSMARVLVNQPMMILMDEPLGALDALTKANMQILIRNIWKKTKSTIFYITHDVDEALMLASRVLIMSERPGHIIEDIPVGFTNEIGSDGNEEVRYKKEYIEMRQKIMNVINMKQ